MCRAEAQAERLLKDAVPNKVRDPSLMLGRTEEGGLF